MHVIFSSFGNDSIALIQWAKDNDLKDVYVVYSDTGWASDDWPERVAKGFEVAVSYGFKPVILIGEGMEAMVKRKKGWSMCASNMQFCTQELKIKPALLWLENIDPDGDFICLVGVRREESKNRRTFPEWTEESEKHGMRSLWAPMVTFNENKRNDLVNKTGLDILPHRSMECFPCVCSNRDDLRKLTPERIEKIHKIEISMGFTRNDKPRTMFRPYRHQGAIGIKEVYQWAMSERGKYQKGQDDMFCDAGMCGL